MAATPVTGRVEPPTPLGQYLALEMTINDTTTTFEVTGPDFSWFAFGFGTTMQGYSLIVEGTGANRTATEWILDGIGQPGGPTPTQYISLVSTSHDAANNLSTTIVTRPSQVGEPNIPDFTTSMTSLDLIWAYSAFASPSAPEPEMIGWHGLNGRGFATITFAPIPEPGTLGLLAMAASATLLFHRRQRR